LIDFLMVSGTTDWASPTANSKSVAFVWGSITHLEWGLVIYIVADRLFYSNLKEKIREMFFVEIHILRTTLTNYVVPDFSDYAWHARISARPFHK
jgi:hypothetical protein